ncbi:hypothetical protein LTR16_004313, partial [Cryomyces antarcticus]
EQRSPPSRLRHETSSPAETAISSSVPTSPAALQTMADREEMEMRLLEQRLASLRLDEEEEEGNEGDVILQIVRKSGAVLGPAGMSNDARRHNESAAVGLRFWSLRCETICVFH